MTHMRFGVAVRIETVPFYLHFSMFLLYCKVCNSIITITLIFCAAVVVNPQQHQAVVW